MQFGRSAHFINVQQQIMPKCQLCPKQAYFTCGRCSKANYCCKQHQITHWKSAHRTRCQKSLQQNNMLDSLMKKKFSTRRHFYENYSAKIYDICLLDVKVMVDLDRRIKKITRDILDEYQYFASVCLLCRIYIVLQDKNSARITMQNFLEQCHDLLHSLDDAVDINVQFSKKQSQILQRKMNLLSTIANLCHILELQCVKYYILYTKHVQKCYGFQSFQASNCYFLMGCYFAEEGFLDKAINCFKKAAAIRGNLAGDCYFNIAVLYKLQKKMSRAIEMFEISFEFRNEQYGEDSEQLAQVYENLGEIYVGRNDFITGMIQYEKAIKIRMVNPVSPEYQRVIELVHVLYDKLCVFIGSDKNELKKLSILQTLQAKILEEDLYWRNKRQKKQLITKQMQAMNIDDKQKVNLDNGLSIISEQNRKNYIKLVLTPEFMAILNPTQLFLLSELQAELSTSTSHFASIYAIGKSTFLHKLPKEKALRLKADNERIFELIRLQEMSKKVL